MLKNQVYRKAPVYHIHPLTRETIQLHMLQNSWQPDRKVLTDLHFSEYILKDKNSKILLSKKKSLREIKVNQQEKIIDF